VIRQGKCRLELNTQVANRSNGRDRDIKMDRERWVINFEKLLRKTNKQEIRFRMIKHERICRYPGTSFSISIIVFSRTGTFERNLEEE
jgi:hypothetical protein